MIDFPREPERRERFTHGMLSAASLLPDADLAPLWAAYGDHPSTMRRLLHLQREIAQGLDGGEPRVPYAPGDIPAVRDWIDGLRAGIELYQEDFTDLNDRHPGSAFALVALQSYNDDALAEGLGLRDSLEWDLRRHPENIPELLGGIYREYRSEPGLDLSDLPEYPPEMLAGMSDDELLDLVWGEGDLLPLGAVQECAKRGDTLLEPLVSELARIGEADLEGQAWWVLLHAPMILGLMSGERAAEALVEVFTRVHEQDADVVEWLSGYWPALCRNKTAHTAEPMRRIAEDQRLHWEPRIEALGCALSAAQQAGASSLEQAIDWVAGICTDEREEESLRFAVAQHLLDLPRPRHRRLLQEMAARQAEMGLIAVYFAPEDVELAFREGDRPEWENFADPWEQLYDPVQIIERRRRWAAEADGEDDDPFSDDWADLADMEPVETSLRESPKVGRNDPCPCGSGKKYKKCCMSKQSH